MKTSDFDYELPERFIAQTPVEPRDSAKLLVLDRQSDGIRHQKFRDLGNFILPGDLLVFNETRVIRARLLGKKILTGGKVEILLLRQHDELAWEVLVKGKGLISGKRVRIEGGLEAEILSVLEGPRRVVRFDLPIEPMLDNIGHVPLPPYIHSVLSDPERYQTIFANQPGSAAAPTAGLHFTPALMEELSNKGIRFVTLTLHIGLDTFGPVKEESPQDHKIHSEWCQLSSAAAEEINLTKARGGRIIAVGTTSVRTLESAAVSAGEGQIIAPYDGSTNLFILPGYEFKFVDAIVTNFHLPKSTLIMLVSAFAGRHKIMSAYRIAKENNYRFYSFGDAMLIL